MSSSTRRARLLAGLGFSLAASAAYSQVGPLEPRMVLASLSSPLPTSKVKDVRPVSVSLTIAPDGRVQEVKLETSSGDPKLDDKLRRYYEKVRLIPALADNGVPIESVYKFVFKTIYSEAPHRSYPGGSPTVATSSAPRSEKVFDEAERITRMRCKDFLWEYDLMKEIAGSRPIYDERMPRTVQAMYIVQEKVTGKAVNDLGLNFTSGVRAAAKECRQRAEDKFFQDVLVPTLRAELAPD